MHLRLQEDLEVRPGWVATPAAQLKIPSQPSRFLWGRGTDTHINQLVSPLQKLVCFIRERVPQLELGTMV